MSAHGPRRGAGNAHSRRSKAGEESETEWCDFLVEGQQSVRVEGEYIYYLNLVNRSVAFTDDFPGQHSKTHTQTHTIPTHIRTIRPRCFCVTVR